MSEAALIQGIELHARTLVPYKTGTEQNTFLVGTQSLRTENQIHKLTYDDDAMNSLNKKSYPHPLGEIWHLSTHPTDPTIIASCFNKVEGDTCSTGGAIFKIGEDLQVIYQLQVPEQVGTDTRQIHFDPSGTTFAALVDCQAVFFDLETKKIIQSTKIEAKNTMKSLAFGFNPPGDLLAINSDSILRGLDSRSLQECWIIPHTHVNQIRSLDFNPNKPNIMATAGDDCAVKFWDLRSLEKPVVTMRHHSHWVWSVRFNPYYDQLVLTGSSDSKVHLLRVASVSSEECDEEDLLLETFDDHEDSTYCTEWAPVDPWLFASISYDGRLVINRVPKEEKFRILC